MRDMLHARPRFPPTQAEEIASKQFALSAETVDGPWHNVLKIKPPLVIGLAQAEQVVAALGEGLGETLEAG